MAIIATNGPVNNGLYPAYRPVFLNVVDNGASVVNTTTGATGIPPEVYCDIYFDGAYYKTISSNVPTLTIGVLSSWLFDISGIAQEYIKTKVYDVTSNTTGIVYDGSANLAGQTYAYCKIRISSADNYGVITPAGPLPVQASLGVSAVAGGGYVSDQSWYIVNASLQIQDSMSLEDMLKAFNPVGTFDSISVVFGYRIYPLSYLTKGSSYINDYGQMALITGSNAFYGGASTTNLRRWVIAYDGSGTIIYNGSLASEVFQSNKIYTLPTGLKNILQLYPALSPFLSTMAYYRVALYDPVNFFIVYLSPRIYYLNRDGAVNGMGYNLPSMNSSTPKHTRIWFKNYLGQFDALNFIERTEKLRISSSNYEVPVSTVPDGYNRSQLSRGRYSVKSSEVNTVTGYFTEADIPMLKQLLSTSQAYIEMTSPEGPSDPPASVLVPIVLLDGEYDTQTWEERYEYPVSIQYMYSNENIIVR